MKMLKIILIFCLLSAALLFAGSFLISPQFEISRTEMINAPHARVILHIADLSSWPKWWPWRQRTGSFTFSSPRLNEGTTFSWTDRPSPGHLKVTESTIYAVRYDIFLDGRQSPIKGTFIFKPTEHTTTATWTLSGKYEMPVLGSYLALIADAQHGGMLSWGLRNLKNEVERDTTPIEVIDEDIRPGESGGNN